jgi:DNA-binding transcriptional regulator WhiA
MIVQFLKIMRVKQTQMNFENIQLMLKYSKDKRVPR